jgi:hypothetical protein
LIYRVSKISKDLSGNPRNKRKLELENERDLELILCNSLKSFKSKTEISF